MGDQERVSIYLSQRAQRRKEIIIRQDEQDFQGFKNPQKRVDQKLLVR